MLRHAPEPAATSSFAAINAIYPHERASDWHRSYLAAALEHLTVWADIAAPLKFHPEHVATFTFRPAHTLARAALEAASQAVWMSSGGSAKECARRHLSLVRWDYVEHRKSQSDPAAKKRIDEMDARLLERAADTFTAEDLRPPNHYTVLRASAPVIEVEPDELEQIWRAASGAAHGKAWAANELQHVVTLDQYEPGQFRTFQIPDAGPMTRVLKVAEKMTLHGVLRHADFVQADIGALAEEARLWLSSVIPYREDADPGLVAFMRQPRRRLP